MKNEWYCSIDIEADGPIPGQNSMLSLGAVLFDSNVIISEYCANLELHPGAVECPKTRREFFDRNPGVYEATRENLVHPRVAMEGLANFITPPFSRKVVHFVGYPAVYDFMFVTWYSVYYLGYSIFGHSGIDMRSYAMGRLQIPYSLASKKHFPKHWKKGRGRHTHLAIDDAREQATLFMNMLNG